MKTKFIQNKKADVPVMLLVLGVVAICALAILSFVGSEQKIEKDLGVELFEKIYADMEKFYFYKNLGLENEEAVEMVNQHIKYPEEDKLVLNGNQLIIERRDILNKSISIKYIKNLK